jgi:hypothetical protein
MHLLFLDSPGRRYTILPGVMIVLARMINGEFIMRRISQIAASLAVAASALAQSGIDLAVPEQIDLHLEMTRREPTTLWERFHMGFNKDMDRAVGRLGPLPAMRYTAFDPDNGPERVNELGFAVLNRAAGHTLGDIIVSSEPFEWMEYRLEAGGARAGKFFANLFHNSIRYMADGISENVRQDAGLPDPVLKPHDVLDDPGDTVVNQTLWGHRSSYGLGLRNGGPSMFISGRLSHERKRLAAWYLQYSLGHMSEHIFSSGISIPTIEKVAKATLGITYGTERDLRFAIRHQVRIWNDWSWVTSASFGKETRGWIGLASSW